MITYTITCLLIYHGSVIYPINGKYTYMVIIIYISYSCYARGVLSYVNDHHESVIYSFSGESLLACIVILVHSKEFILINSCVDILRDSC